MWIMYQAFNEAGELVASGEAPADIGGNMPLTHRAYSADTIARLRRGDPVRYTSNLRSARDVEILAIPDDCA